ncbi:MAG: PAS domain-containing protein [Burkholderiales bacterium]
MGRTDPFASVKTDQRCNHPLFSDSSVVYILRFEADRFDGQWVSDDIVRLMGYSPHEALQPRWWVKNIHPDDLAAAVRANARLFKDGRANYEYRFRRKDGVFVHLQDQARLLRDKEGNPAEMVGCWTVAGVDDHGHHKDHRPSLRSAA